MEAQGRKKQGRTESEAAWWWPCPPSSLLCLGATERSPRACSREKLRDLWGLQWFQAQLKFLKLEEQPRRTAFGEINLKGKKYFPLQHILRPNSARAKANRPQALSPGATSARKPEATRQSTCLPTGPCRGRLHKGGASKRGCRVDSGSQPGDQLRMACLQITRSLKTE